MKRSTVILIVAAVLALVGGLGYWVYSNLEWEEVSVPVPVRGPARTNNLLAAERMSTRLGSEADAAFGIQGALKLIDNGATHAGKNSARTVLMLPTPRRTLIPRHLNALQEWVRAGGHLIAVTYTLEGESDFPDALLTNFGFRQFRTTLGEKSRPTAPRNDEEGESEKEGEERRKREAEKRAEEILKRLSGFRKREDKCGEVIESGILAPRFPTGRGALSACFNPNFRLEGNGDALWSVASQHGVHLLTLAHGKGKVTVLTDYELFQNEWIGNADHADLFAAMVGFNDAGARPAHVYFMPREDYDSIHLLAWQHAWPVIVVLTLLVILCIWRWGARFGPVYASKSNVRRSLAEHVRASGEFLFRHGQSTTLWRATLEATRRRAERVLPRATFQNEEAYVAALATRSGIGADHLRAVFVSPHPPLPEQFANCIATLNQLRNTL